MRKMLGHLKGTYRNILGIFTNYFGWWPNFRGRKNKLPFLEEQLDGFGPYLEVDPADMKGVHSAYLRVQEKSTLKLDDFDCPLL